MRKRRRSYGESTRVEQAESSDESGPQLRTPVDGILAHAVAWGAPVSYLYASTDPSEPAELT